MGIFQLVAQIDELNRKIQGRPERQPGQSPFGKYAAKGKKSRAREAVEDLFKRFQD